MLDKYKNRGLTVLAINVEPAQNALVLPVMKALHLYREQAYPDNDGHQRVEHVPATASPESNSTR